MGMLAAYCFNIDLLIYDGHQRTCYLLPRRVLVSRTLYDCVSPSVSYRLAFYNCLPLSLEVLICDVATRGVVCGLERGGQDIGANLA